MLCRSSAPPITTEAFPCKKKTGSDPTLGGTGGRATGLYPFESAVCTRVSGRSTRERETSDTQQHTHTPQYTPVDAYPMTGGSPQMAAFSQPTKSPAITALGQRALNAVGLSGGQKQKQLPTVKMVSLWVARRQVPGPTLAGSSGDSCVVRRQQRYAVVTRWRASRHTLEHFAGRLVLYTFALFSGVKLQNLLDQSHLQFLKSM